jgi:hypothetical protein
MRIEYGCNLVGYGASYVCFHTCPSIVQQPQSQTVCPGAAVTFTVVVDGSLPPLHYQWRWNYSDIPGATDTSYTIDPVQAGDAGAYDCVIGNGCGNISSDAATLTVMPAIAQQPQSNAVCAGGIMTASASAIGFGTLHYQWRKDGTNLSDGGNISGATTDLLTISPFNASDEASYDVVVNDDCGETTSAPALLTADLGPVITESPQSQVGLVDDSAQFNVVAEGLEPFGYQWFKDDVALTDDGHFYGTDTPTLVIAPVAPGDDGQYAVLVTNPCGEHASEPATFMVWFPADMNCDGHRDFDDIDPFVLALSDPAGWQALYPGCYYLNGDCNGDGVVNFDDIDAFVQLLSR